MQLGRSDFLMGIGVALVWGMGIVVAKSAITHFPPILLMSFRFLVTASVLIWFVKPPKGFYSSLFWISIVSAAIQYSLTFTGLRSLDASVAALVVQLEVPFLIILGVALLGERASLRKWIGVVIAFLGVMLIAGEPKLDGKWGPLLLVMGGAFAWAVGQIMVRRLKDVSGLTITAWVAVFASPQLAVMTLIFETGQTEAIANAGWNVWAAVLYLGLVMTAIGYFMWYTLVTRHPVNKVAPFLLLLPVFSVIGGVSFLQERLTWQIAAGGCIIILGVALILLERQAAVPIEEPEL